MEDPHKHLRNFIEVANTFRNPNISDDVLRLKLFPHSLADKAKEWLNSFPSNSITNWHTLAEKFIMKFFPSNKVVQTRGDIANFMQRDGETLVDVWERYKNLLKQCPNHGLPSWAVLQTLYNGLNTQNRALADSAANGMFMTMSFNQAHELLEQMTQNYAQWPEERNQPRRVAGLHEIDPVTALSAKFDALSNLVRTQGQTIEARLSQSQVPAPQIPVTQPQVNAINTSVTCVCCGGPHLYDSCPSNPESVFYVGNQNRNQNIFPNNFNQGWRQNQQPQYFQGQGQQAGPSNAQTKIPFPTQNYQQTSRQQAVVQPSEMPIAPSSSLEALLREYLVKNETKQNSLEAVVQSIPASLRNIESQLGHLANTMNTRPPGTLPSNTEEPRRNKEQCNMIELRNDRSVNQSEAVVRPSTLKKEEGENMQKEKDANSEPVQNSVVHNSPQGVVHNNCSPILVESDTQPSIDEPLGNNSIEKPTQKGLTPKPNSETPATSKRPPPPFPQRLQKQKQDNQFRKFLDLLKQLHVNIPFVDALEQMPSYVKFMKEILSRKRRLEEFETVALTQ
ncbi:uncharacterized protein LOC133310973 [Gastrolobium bilobum]|uniref:uncharacterized protein LOC133310973 n=1 Tax=Gastrolobium bilobum TaxID=150636 RepID=UPI002AAF67F4|nr:uncharacterized protein LOC133310973 [Gastrolobium bilobum]